MKILSIFGEQDGSAAWVRASTIAKILRSDGHQVDFLHYSSGCETVYESVDEFGRHIHLPHWGPFSQLNHCRFLSRHGYDLLYGNTHICTFKFMLARMLGASLVFDMHGGLLEEYSLVQASGNSTSTRYFRYHLIDYMDTTFSSKIVCVSQSMLESLRRRGVPEERLRLITNGVDLAAFKPEDGGMVRSWRNEMGLGDKFVFGYVGALQKYQGVDSLHAAAKHIKCSDTHFLFVGGEEARCDDNIQFIPKVPRKDVNRFYSVCDVLVLPRPHHPSTVIAAPTKLAEYAAMGKPILTTDVGDSGMLVRKYDCGLVVKDDSAESLIAGMNELRQMDPARLREMGTNSRSMAESEFDWNKIAPKVWEVVNSIAK